jgi:outer membrane protein OmpA-like peptidoglycan-associated protein
LIAAAVLVATSATAAERSGFYIGGDVGESSWNVTQKDANNLAADVANGLANFGAITPDKGKVSDYDTTYSLFIGYQFGPYFAVEGSWMDLGKETLKATGRADFLYVGPHPSIDPVYALYNANDKFESSGFALSVLPMLPIGESWDLYARLGYYWGDNKLSGKFSAQNYNLNGTTNGSPYEVSGHKTSSGDQFLWGAGIGYTWNQRVSARLEYNNIANVADVSNHKSDVERFTVGLVYRFGHVEEAMPVAAAAPVAAVAAAPTKCKDSDNDGVCDSADRCPNTPAGDRVGPYGCSCDVTVRTHFAFDSADLTAEDKAQLDKVATRLHELEFVEGVANGYTDNVGDEAYNQKLSERRAQAVVDYLAAKGLAPGRIKAVGYGEAKPLADNSTEEGRAQNRRVTIHRTDCGPAN